MFKFMGQGVKNDIMNKIKDDLNFANELYRDGVFRYELSFFSVKLEWLSFCFLRCRR